MSRQPQIQRRLLKNRLFFLGISLFSFALFLPLFFIILYIIKNGLALISFDFLTQLPPPPGQEGGGIANAIVGTFLLIVIASVLAVPLGILAGIYLAENRSGRFSEFIRFCVEILQGTPSIVIGIVAYSWVVLPMGGFSAFSGGVALAIMMMPVIVRTTEETLKLIPETYKEASMALGTPYYKTMLRIVIPTGLSGILSGILLSIARIAGETAPLLFTAFGNPFLTVDVTKPVQALPLLIFNYATSPYDHWRAMAWGASFVLIAFILGLSILVKVVAKR